MIGPRTTLICGGCDARIPRGCSHKSFNGKTRDIKNGTPYTPTWCPVQSKDSERDVQMNGKLCALNNSSLGVLGGSTIFTKYELKAMAESPEMLREVAEYHECQITMADSMGFPYDYHDRRKKELLTKADCIEEGY